MKMKMKIAAVALVAASLAVGTGVMQAEAASTTTTGTLNCGGYDVYFATTRAKASAGELYYALSDQTGSTYGTDGTFLGVHIVKTNTYLPQHFMYLPQSPNADLGGSAYVVGTSFTLWGSMYPSNGACDNYFAGTLTY